MKVTKFHALEQREEMSSVSGVLLLRGETLGQVVVNSSFLLLFGGTPLLRQILSSSFPQSLFCFLHPPPLMMTIYMDDEFSKQECCVELF